MTRAVMGILLAGALFPAPEWAAPRDFVRITAPAPPQRAVRGRRLEITLGFTVAPGYHINSSKPSQPYMIPTRLEWSASVLRHLEDVFPSAKSKQFSFSPRQRLSVYEGEQTLKARFAVPETAPPGRIILEGKLRYQACDDKACYPQARVTIQVPVEIPARE